MDLRLPLCVPRSRRNDRQERYVRLHVGCRRSGRPPLSPPSRRRLLGLACPARGQLIEQSSKSTGKTLIREGRCGKFIFLPSGFAAAGSGSHLCHLRAPVAPTESRQIHEKQWDTEDVGNRKTANCTRPTSRGLVRSCKAPGDCCCAGCLFTGRRSVCSGSMRSCLPGIRRTRRSQKCTWRRARRRTSASRACACSTTSSTAA